MIGTILNMPGISSVRENDGESFSFTYSAVRGLEIKNTFFSTCLLQVADYLATEETGQQQSQPAGYSDPKLN